MWYRFCDVNAVFAQFKQMASLDYAAIADNVVREAIVFATETPEVIEQIKIIKSAGECLVQTAEELIEEVEEITGEFTQSEGTEGGDQPQEAKQEEPKGDEGSFESFQAEVEAGLQEEVEEKVEEVLDDIEDCLRVVDRW